MYLKIIYRINEKKDNLSLIFVKIGIMSFEPISLKKDVVLSLSGSMNQLFHKISDNKIINYSFKNVHNHYLLCFLFFYFRCCTKFKH